MGERWTGVTMNTLIRKNIFFLINDIIVNDKIIKKKVNLKNMKQYI
jgi:hypothetical protein